MPTASINGIKIYYELKGKQEGNEAVIFLNGVMSTVSGWALQVPVFEKAGFKIMLHDFRGQLLSEKPKEDYTFAQHVQDLKVLLDQLGIEKVHIICTSYGSIVGLRFALDLPEYVKSMTMIDALSEADSNFCRIIAFWQDILKGGDMLKFFRAVVPTIYSNYFIENNEKALREREQLLKGLPRDFMEAFSRLLTNAVTNVNYTGELHKIKCPVFIAVGELDLLTPLTLSQIIKREIPHAEFVVVPQSGHTTVYEKPDIVNTLALGFILKNCN